MHKEAREELKVRFKLAVLEIAAHYGVRKACRNFGVPRSSFYEWKTNSTRKENPVCREKSQYLWLIVKKKPSGVVEKILELRKGYKMGALRIMCYLARYHGIRISESRQWHEYWEHMVWADYPKPLPDVLFTPNATQKLFPDIMYRWMFSFSVLKTYREANWDVFSIRPSFLNVGFIIGLIALMMGKHLMKLWGLSYRSWINVQ